MDGWMDGWIDGQMDDDSFSICPQAQDLSVIEEVIRMMLEIINSCLANSLHLNPNLVYALLYKRELFEQFRMHPSFQDIMQNLDTVRMDTHAHTRAHTYTYTHTSAYCAYTNAHT
jgi:hypothetical protein